MNADTLPWTLKDRHKSFLGDADPKRGRMKLKGVNIDHENRTVSGIIAADVLDLEREAIVPKGIRFGPKRYFMGTVKAVYLEHSWADKSASAYERLPVATCRQLAYRGDSLFALTQITKRAIGDELLILIDEGALDGLSVGVLGDDEGPPTHVETKRYGDACQNVIRTSDMLEYSLTSMPCNPEAVLKCYRKGVVRRTTASIFLPDVTPERKSFPVSGPALCGKTILLGENMELSAVLG